MPVNPLPATDLPTVTYTIRHPEGEEARTRPCVHLITYGHEYGKPQVLNFDSVLKLDLSGLEAPPRDLCDHFTGQDTLLVNSFFSVPANEKTFENALAELRYEIRKEAKRQPPGRCIAFRINCTIGRHRSVAMAERLAKAVASMDFSRAECLHLDLKKGSKPPSEDAVQKSFTLPMNTAQAMPETHRGFPMPKGAGIADTAHYRREGPSQNKIVSLETRPFRQPGNQEHENSGRSARPRREEGRSRRL